jgi:hypothetical protein
LPRASWLALLSLAWMQLAIAGHQFEHSADYTDVCEFCVQVDRLDDVVAAPPATLEVPRLASHPGISLAEGSVADLEISCFNPRAPPLL